MGQMSLVGPRPHVPGMIVAGERYAELVPQYRLRQLMRPGMTGWAQCNGLRGPVDTQPKAVNRVGHDIAYVQHFSVVLDFRIMLRTLVALTRDWRAS